MMRRFGLLAFVGAAALAGACQEPDPNYGDPDGIIGKTLPHEKPTGITGAAPTQTDSVAAKHAAGGGPALPITANCFSCHGSATTPTAPPLAFGGFVGDSTGKGIAGIAITIGSIKSTASDKDGYFWTLGTDGTIAKGDSATVGTTLMGPQLTGPADGDCAKATSCHGTGGAGGAIHP